MPFWCLQFSPKKEQKQVNLRFHSSKVEFVRSFFGGNVYLKKSFRLFLTFTQIFLKFPKKLQDVTKSSTSTIVPKDSEAAEATEALSYGGQISYDDIKRDQLLLKWEADMGTKYTIVVINAYFHLILNINKIEGTPILKLAMVKR